MAPDKMERQTTHANDQEKLRVDINLRGNNSAQKPKQKCLENKNIKRILIESGKMTTMHDLKHIDDRTLETP